MVGILTILVRLKQEIASSLSCKYAYVNCGIMITSL